MILVPYLKILNGLKVAKKPKSLPVQVFRGSCFFLPQLASKLQAVESGSPEKVPGKGAFYYINHHNPISVMKGSR